MLRGRRTSWRELRPVKVTLSPAHNEVQIKYGKWSKKTIKVGKDTTLAAVRIDTVLDKHTNAQGGSQTVISELDRALRGPQKAKKATAKR
jgi:hypothetical protein